MSISYLLQKCINCYANYKDKHKNLLFEAAKASHNFSEYKDRVTK